MHKFRIRTHTRNIWLEHALAETNNCETGYGRTSANPCSASCVSAAMACVDSKQIYAAIDGRACTDAIIITGSGPPHEGRQAHVVPSWFIESLQSLALKFARPEDALRADAIRPFRSGLPCGCSFCCCFWGRLMLMGHSLITKATKTGHYSVRALDGILIQCNSREHTSWRTQNGSGCETTWHGMKSPRPDRDKLGRDKLGRDKYRQ